jgi:hypothetical protein
MRRLTIYITISILALSIGIVSTWIYQINYPRFQSKSVWGGTGYVVHDFISSDGEDITLYHEFTSPEQTRYLFQSNLTAAKLIEQGSKPNGNGQKVGERAVIVFPSDEKNEAARIFWTEGEEFWFIQASSLKLAEEFESSDMYRSARSNNSFNPTPR